MSVFLFFQTFKLVNVTEADTNWYHCKVENEFGPTYSTAYVEVLQELPEDPSKKRRRYFNSTKCFPPYFACNNIIYIPIRIIVIACIAGALLFFVMIAVVVCMFFK